MYEQYHVKISDEVYFAYIRNSGQIMYIIPELVRALEENLGSYKHQNTLVLFLSIFPEQY